MIKVTIVVHSFFHICTHKQIYARRHLNRAAPSSNDVIISQHYNYQHLVDQIWFPDLYIPNPNEDYFCLGGCHMILDVRK